MNMFDILIYMMKQTSPHVFPYDKEVGEKFDKNTARAYSLTLARFGVIFPVKDIILVESTYPTIIDSLLKSVGDRNWKNTLFTFKQMVEEPLEVLVEEVLKHYFSTYGVEWIAEVFGLDLELLREYIPVYFPNGLRGEKISNTEAKGKSKAEIKYEIKAVPKEEYFTIVSDYLRRVTAPTSDLIKAVITLQNEMGFVTPHDVKSKELKAIADINNAESLFRLLLIGLLGRGTATIAEIKKKIKKIEDTRELNPAYPDLFKLAVDRLLTTDAKELRDVEYYLASHRRLVGYLFEVIKNVHPTELRNSSIRKLFKKLTRNSARKMREVISKRSPYKTERLAYGQDLARKFANFGQLIRYGIENNKLQMVLDNIRVGFRKNLDAGIPVMTLVRAYAYLNYLVREAEGDTIKADYKIVFMPTISKTVDSNDIHRTVELLANSRDDLNRIKRFLTTLKNRIVKKLNNAGGIKLDKDTYNAIKGGVKDYALYTTSSEWGMLPPGSYVTMEGNVLLGVHWYNLEIGGRKIRVDLDLSGLLIDLKTRMSHTFAWNSTWAGSFEGNSSIVFSGDLTDAPRPYGAAELYYVQRLPKDWMLMVYVYRYAPNNGTEYDNEVTALFGIRDGLEDLLVGNVKKFLTLGDEELPKSVATMLEEPEFTPESLKFAYTLKFENTSNIIPGMLVGNRFYVLNLRGAGNSRTLSSDKEFTHTSIYLFERIKSRLTLKDLIDVGLKVNIIDEEEESFDLIEELKRISEV